jgi:hypothetical protein
LDAENPMGLGCRIAIHMNFGDGIPDPKAILTKKKYMYLNPHKFLYTPFNTKRPIVSCTMALIHILAVMMCRHLPRVK